MGSSNSNGQGGDPGRRRRPIPKRSKAVPGLEALEGRTLMAGPGDSPPTFVPTSTNPLNVQHGPLARAGGELIQLYREYQTFLSSNRPIEQFQPSNTFLRVQNGLVGVDVLVYGDVNAYSTAVAADQSIRLNVASKSQAFHSVEGFISIANLVNLANFKRVSGNTVTLQTVGIAANVKPITLSVGAVANQAEDVLGIPAALAQFPGITGSGITVGVLSDSVNRFAGGLADSIATGDLPPLPRINVLLDEPVGGNNTDEGRAMLEEIYDIAPGANLAFNTAFLGIPEFADGIRALSRVAGAQVIVDDIGYRDEPFYQVGQIEQAISEVVNQDNRVYFSSAGNSADGGFESPFRATTATVGGLTGTFMDFDPGPGVATSIPVTVTAGGQLSFQYDQPLLGVTSDLDVLLLDAAGNVLNAPGGNRGGRDNNLALQAPRETTIVANDVASIAVIVNSGPAPGRIQFSVFGSVVNFSRNFDGPNSGISHPSSTGHNAGIDTIGVGAVPFFNAPPFGTQSPLQNEPFSSFGPRVLVYDAAGTRIGTQVLQRPQVSGVDAVNTTFFSPGGDIPQDPDDFPNFFGTSAAAPNLAALAALMRQVSPGINKTDVLDALIQSARPLNGAAKGVYDPQGGFGLPVALQAFNVIDRLRVQAVSVPVGSVRSTSIDQIAFVFNKAVDPSSIQASDLVFTQTPPGVTVQVLNTFYSAASNAVIFTLRFNKPPNALANGTYAYTLADGAFTGTDGRSSVAFAGNFAINDTTAPKVTATTLANRIIVINFSEAMDPLTIDRNSILLIRTGSSGTFNNPSNVQINNLPGYKVTYDPNLRRAVVDLNAIPQSALPTDRYALVVRDIARDLVGNRLDGEFNGFTAVFPSGNGQPGGDFVQDFGRVTLTAPRVLFVGLLPADDTGIPTDQNTLVRRPRFIGQVSSAFPGALGGLRVVVQFNALHGGVFDLAAGSGGRGIAPGANIDVETTTNADGSFSFQAPAELPSGFHRVRVVVVGQSDSPPLPGLSTQFDQSFRIDTSNPFLVPVNVPQEARLSSLAGGITLGALDPVQPASSTSPLAVPTQFRVPALNPETATNISNYSLINLGANRVLGGADDVDFSSFINGATYIDTTNRPRPIDWYSGQVNLSFDEGLPAGRYMLVARFPQPGFPGITDAAGNYLDGAPGTPGIQNFALNFEFQPVPTFVTNVIALSPDVNGVRAQTGPRAFYEVPQPGTTPRAPVPPNEFFIDFSGPLNRDITDAQYSDRVFLVRSADTGSGPSDGDFGLDSTFSSGIGYTRVPGTTVQLRNSISTALGFGQPGFQNRLILTIPAGTSLPPDKYRLVIPNQILGNGTDARIFDAFNNPATGMTIDGEFLGNPKPNGIGFENLLPTGEFRPGLSGDLVPGGSFETGFVVVPNGNVVFVKPDVNDDELLTSDDPDGSRARPFSTLAPEAIPNGINGGDLNSSANFSTGFNPNLDINGNGRFDRSAFYAASQLASRGPVVVVALAPDTNDPFNRTFVLQLPSQAPGRPTIPDGSATVPFNTLLAFQPGSILKMRNASLYVQNQGSAIQFNGGPNPDQRVYVTSYNDDSIGGDTNRDGAPISQGGTGTNPFPGDYGGILLRNFNDTTNGSRPIPITPGPDDPTLPQVDDRQRLGISGADEALSVFNFATFRFGGGSVPQGGGQNNVFRFDHITLFNARPAITNVVIDGFQTPNGGLGPNGGSQGGVSGDFDSFREDALARGPLIRRTTISRTSLNGIYVRAEQNGTIEPSNAIFYPNNPTSLGGAQNYTFDDPLPYIVVARIQLGRRLQHNTGLDETGLSDRLYVQPGMIVKFQRGSSLQQSANASLNIGDRTYIRQFDGAPNLAPTDPSFAQQKVGDARVIFTSFFDDAATTFYVNPTTGARTTIIAPVDSDNGTGNRPTPGNVPALARWGSFNVQSGGRAVVDEAEFRYGGGTVNLAGGTIGQRDVLAFLGDFSNAGTRAVVTNNDFFDNLEAPVSVTPNGLLAADPLRPLQSGNPFFRGNVMERNDVNGLEVIPSFQNGLGGGGVFGYVPNLTVNSVWDDTDVTYVLRGTIRLDGYFSPPIPPDDFTTELLPRITLTIQAGLADTLLANGNRIANPGETNIVKLLNTRNRILGDGVNGMPAGDIFSDENGGAGFLVGFDDGVDPTTDPLIDPGVDSQIRILGIGGNETTGQPRVPVIITSLRDSTVGRVIRGERLFATTTPAYVAGFGFTGADPQPGDGGVIGYGGNSLSDYNVYDPRDGNLIDNADIRYIARIEQQGGGIAYSFDPDLPDAIGFDKTGINNSPDFPPLFGFPIQPTDPWYQYNTAKALTISNSNLASFSQAGVIAHPSGSNQIHFQKHPTAPQPERGSALGEPVLLHLYNNTIANTPVAIRINAETANNDADPSPMLGVFYNNTFYNNAEGIHTEAPTFNGQNSLSHVYFLAMDNIFANSSDAAVRIVGQNTSSQLLYNLYDGNATDVDDAAGEFQAGPFNAQAIFGNAGLRNPAKGDFALTPLSDAIDASISEVTQAGWGNLLSPIATQRTDAVAGFRDPNLTGRFAQVTGGLGEFSVPGDLVTLPGFPVGLRGFNDQFVPAIPGTPGALPGPSNITGGGAVFSYRPIDGERDNQGFLRQDAPGRANVGFGSRPFFDIGANEFRELFPAHVTDVTATVPTPVANPTGPGTSNVIDIYAEGGIAGTNQAPTAIQIQFDQRIDPTTLTGLTVLLQASGGDGIFGNANSSADRFIPLSGRLSYNPLNSTLSIGLGSAGLALDNDLYRITLRGDGDPVVRNEQGLPLDGESTGGGDPNNVQLPLPSGDGTPGGDFFVTFSVDTVAPIVVAGSLRLEPQGPPDPRPNDPIISDNTPTFTGQITDVPPPSNPQSGQTVLLDIDLDGNGTFERLAVGTATTDAQGFFSVTVTTPLPDSPNLNVGPDGIIGTDDDTGYSVARVRVIDQSGNISNPNDPSNRVRFVVDTKGPRVTGTDPLPGVQATANGGVLQVSVAFNENLEPSSLTTSSILVTRSGGDGTFGDGNEVSLLIDPASITQQYLKTPGGAVILRFSVPGLTTNDLYRITLVGSGAGITDVAGNLLDGESSGTLPSGDGTPGGDFSFDFIIFNPANSQVIFVGPNSGSNTGTGTFSNPYRTIQEGIDAAGLGDTVAVFAGRSVGSPVVYTEPTITLKSLVKVISIDPSSSPTTLIPGLALKAIIRPSAPTDGSPSVTIQGNDLVSTVGFATQVRGFTIASPLTGNGANTPILPGSIGIRLINSDVLVDRNYFIDSNVAIVAATSNLGRAPQIRNNGIIGNNIGVFVGDIGGSTTGFQNSQVGIPIINNTFAFNTFGTLIDTDTSGPTIADIENNIFFQNADRTTARNGAAISANNRDRTRIASNLFTANGPSASSTADDTINVGGGFNPSLLSIIPDANGNLTGAVTFFSPIDPRPNGNGPANFYLGANYDITSGSTGAIDNANNSIAPATDFRFRGRIDIPNRGFAGPADIGAFEFNGTGGIGSGSSSGGNGSGGGFTLSARSIGTDGASASAPPTTFATGLDIPFRAPGDAPLGSGVTSTAVGLGSVTVHFGGRLDRGSVQATDLLLSGNALDATHPARAVGLNWIDDQTVKFNLDGSFRSSGSVQLDIPPGAIRNADGTLVPEYSSTQSAPVAVAAPLAVVAAAAPALLATPEPAAIAALVTASAPVQQEAAPVNPTPVPLPAQPMTRREALLARRAERRADIAQRSLIARLTRLGRRS